MRDVMEGTASSTLMDSIRVATARYLPGADTEHLDGGESVAELAHRVKSELMADTDRFSLSKLAALLNILYHDSCSGRHASHWLLVALASRMCMGMSLNIENNDLDAATPGYQFVERETRKRLMWSAFAHESLASGGIREYMLLPLSIIKISAPCSERNFALCVPTRTRNLNELESSMAPIPEQEDGLLVRYLLLVAIRNDLLQ